MLDWKKLEDSVGRLDTVEASVEKLINGLNEAISDARNEVPTDTTTQNVLDGLQQRIDSVTSRMVKAVKKGTDAEGEKVVDNPPTAPASSINQADGQTAGDVAGNPATDAPPPQNAPFVDNPKGGPKTVGERPASPGQAPFKRPADTNLGAGKTSDQAASAVESMGPNDGLTHPFDEKAPMDTTGPQPPDEGKTGPLGG